MYTTIKPATDQFEWPSIPAASAPATISDHASVEEKADVKFCFATPYHSWERGTNENFNGLVRQYLPKRKTQKHVTQEDCDAIARQLNDRPRKRLGYRSPREVLFGE